MIKFDIPVEKIQDQYVDDTSQFIEIDGLNVHYKDEGYGESLILLHDSVTSLHLWDKWIPYLTQQFRVIRLDLPGFGVTGTTMQQSLSIDQYIYFLKKFTTQLGLGLEDFYIGGLSLGGHIAWQYTLLHPYKIKKLLLIESLGYPEQTGPFTLRMGKNWLGRMVLRWWGSKRWIRRNLNKEFGDKGKVDNDLVQRTLDLMLRKGNRSAMIRLANTKSKNRNQRISQIKTPTLILQGTLNNNKNRFSEDLPNVQQINYEGMGRYLMLEIPERSANDVINFLQS